jgi:hypothetical protein
LKPKIRDQEVLTHPLAYCTWFTEAIFSINAKQINTVYTRFNPHVILLLTREYGGFPINILKVLPEFCFSVLTYSLNYDKLIAYKRNAQKAVN